MAERVNIGVSLENVLTIALISGVLFMLVIGLRKAFPGPAGKVDDTIRAAASSV